MGGDSPCPAGGPTAKVWTLDARIIAFALPRAPEPQRDLAPDPVLAAELEAVLVRLRGLMATAEPPVRRSAA